MKNYLVIFLFYFAIICLDLSCTKYQSTATPYPPRTIKYALHTEKDFSSNNDSITFSIYIRTHTQILFDSTVAVMKIKDIPDSAHKILIEKKVPGDDGSDLGVGFHYTIKNVGSSSFIDTCAAGTLFKLVDFSFQ